MLNSADICYYNDMSVPKLTSPMNYSIARPISAMENYAHRNGRIWLVNNFTEIGDIKASRDEFLLEKRVSEEV